MGECRISNSPAPIACSLSGGGYAERVQQWRRMLAANVVQRQADGTMRTVLDIDQLPDLVVLIADETRCCPFFTFTLTITHAGIQLDAAAPDDARLLLDELFLGAPAENRQPR